jgi:hypothetical protein
MVNLSRLTNGGTVMVHELVSFLFRACKGQAKGVFANFLCHLSLSEVSYSQVTTGGS